MIRVLWKKRCTKEDRLDWPEAHVTTGCKSNLASRSLLRQVSNFDFLGLQNRFKILMIFWIVFGAVLGPILGPILALLGAQVGPTSLQDGSWDALFC